WVNKTPCIVRVPSSAPSERDTHHKCTKIHQILPMRSTAAEPQNVRCGTGTRPAPDPASERNSGDLEEPQNGAIGIERARAQENAGHQPPQVWVGGFKSGHGAKIDRT